MLKENIITELEKHIYNKHLIVSRIMRNKPFKTKKDFSDIVNTDKHKHLKRIAILLKKHPTIDVDTFFQAPYELYPDVQYFGLDYFATLRAIKSYTLYKKINFLKDPDKQIEDVKKSLRFIAHYCLDQNIYFHQYPYQKTGDIFSWMIHFKENKINPFAMMEFKDVFSSVQTLTEEVQKFYVSNFIEYFKGLYTSYNKSLQLKPFLKKAMSPLNNFVNSQLTNQQK